MSWYRRVEEPQAEEVVRSVLLNVSDHMAVRTIALWGMLSLFDQMTKETRGSLLEALTIGVGLFLLLAGIIGILRIAPELALASLFVSIVLLITVTVLSFLTGWWSDISSGS